MKAFMLMLIFLFAHGRRRIDLVGGICAAFAVSVFVAPLGIIVSTHCYLTIKTTTHRDII